jgi:hypothetical protein
VAIKGAKVEVNTDSQGVYYLANIGPGNTALTVSYTGLNTVDLTVAVRTGGVTRYDRRKGYRCARFPLPP